MILKAEASYSLHLSLSRKSLCVQGRQGSMRSEIFVEYCSIVVIEEEAGMLHKFARNSRWVQITAARVIAENEAVCGSRFSSQSHDCRCHQL